MFAGTGRGRDAGLGNGVGTGFSVAGTDGDWNDTLHPSCYSLTFSSHNERTAAVFVFPLPKKNVVHSTPISITY